MGSSPVLVTVMELWQTWCMRRTENPENMVRLHEAPQYIFAFNGIFLFKPFFAVIRDVYLSHYLGTYD